MCDNVRSVNDIPPDPLAAEASPNATFQTKMRHNAFYPLREFERSLNLAAAKGRKLERKRDGERGRGN